VYHTKRVRNLDGFGPAFGTVKWYAEKNEILRLSFASLLYILRNDDFEDGLFVAEADVSMESAGRCTTRRAC
jgi:hypothetical protein